MIIRHFTKCLLLVFSLLLFTKPAQAHFFEERIAKTVATKSDNPSRIINASNVTEPFKTKAKAPLAPENFELIMATTGYGFNGDLAQFPNGIESEWIERIESFNYSWGWGITGIALTVTWDKFEPTPGNYQLAALQKAIDYCDARGLTLSIMFIARRQSDDGFLLESERVKGNHGRIYGTSDGLPPGAQVETYPSYGCDRTNALIFNAVKKIAEKLSTYSRAGYMTIGGGHTAELVNHVIGDGAAAELGDFSDDNLARFNQWCTSRGLASPGTPPIQDGFPWPHPNFGDARGLEFARFLSYNIGKYQRNFAAAVKSVSNIPVIYTYAAASNQQLRATSNANMNYIAATSDGMYGSEGDGVGDHVAKFRVNAVNLGNFPNGISCVEFDPDDWSTWRQNYGGTPLFCDNHFLHDQVKNSMQLLYNKGVRYIHLTMSFCPEEIQGMSSVLQQLRQSHVGKPYVRPAINSSNTVTVEVTQKYRNSEDLVSGIDVYNQYVKYTDNDFWGGVAPDNGSGCTPPAAPTLTAAPASIMQGGSSTLTASNYVANGTVNWVGLGTGASKTVTPSTTTTYYATVTKDGCTSSQASVTVTVETPPGNGSTICSSSNVIGYGNSSENGTYTINNTGAAGTYTIKLSYSRYEATSAASGSIKVNNGSSQALSFPYTSANPDSYQELTFSANLISGNNTFQVFGGSNGFFRTQKVCFVSQQTCTPPAAPTLTANPASIVPGGSSTLTAGNYVSGGTITWVNLGTGASKTVTPSTTTTYYATVTKDGCTSSQASVTVNVGIPSSINCSTLQSDFGGANCFNLNGWIYDQSNPNTVVNIDVYEGSTLIAGNIPAGNFRQDLLDAGKGNGYHGFQFDTPSQLKNGQNRSITLKATGCSYVLSGSPRTINCAGCTAPNPPTLSASSSTIAVGQTVSLTANGCSGAVTWGHTSSTSATVSVTPTTNTTYTATCTVNGCTSSPASIAINFNSASSINCNTLESDFGGANCLVLSGWIYDQSHPNTVVNIDVYEGSTLILGNIPAGNFRQDLLSAGKGNGYHGFQFDTPSQLKNGQNRTLTVKATGCNYVLTGSPRTINCSPGARMAASDENPVSAEDAALDITVAPNPNSGVFDVSFYVESKKATLSVIDQKGSTRFKKEVSGRGQHSVKVALPDGASGTYQVVLVKGNGKKTKRVVVID